jgi:hypothetical protein
MRRLKSAEHAAWMGVTRNVYRILRRWEDN